MDVPAGYSQLTTMTAAKNLGQGSLGAIPAGAAYALVTCEAQGVRWRDDSTPPTATVGMPMAAGDSMMIDTAIPAIQFIAQTAGAILNVTFWKTTNTLMGGRPRKPNAKAVPSAKPRATPRRKNGLGGQG